MLRNYLIGVLLLLGILILADGRRRQPPPAQVTVATPPALIPSAVNRASRAPLPAPPVAPAASTPGSPGGSTPYLDMLARLAVRQRIQREADGTYLDSLLAETDSVVTRWIDRRTLRVRLVSDSSMAGWTPALLAEARAAMHAWEGNAAGLVLQEIAGADSADVTVRWVPTLPDSTQVGTTNVTWGPDGEIHFAAIQLALMRKQDGRVLAPADRIQVAVHEFGHALGLPHSGDQADVMFHTSPVNSPSGRDQATLRLLYAVPPGSLKVKP
jgi:hypothetical protein